MLRSIIIIKNFLIICFESVEPNLIKGTIIFLWADAYRAKYEEHIEDAEQVNSEDEEREKEDYCNFNK